jgi:hypothetical protein
MAAVYSDSAAVTMKESKSKREGRIFCLQGAVFAGSTSTLFTLPDGLRPLKNAYIATDLCNATNGRLHLGQQRRGHGGDRRRPVHKRVVFHLTRGHLIHARQLAVPTCSLMARRAVLARLRRSAAWRRAYLCCASIQV